MQTIEYPPVQQALARLTTLSADAETRRLAFVRERALFNEATAINAAIAKGKLEGKLETLSTLLTRQLNKRFGPLSIETSQRLQLATSEQLECWADRILDAPTLAAVFDAH